METNTKRGLATKPTRKEVAAAWSHLRNAAGAGDLQASALLVALAENKPLISLADAIGAQNDQGECA